MATTITFDVNGLTDLDRALLAVLSGNSAPVSTGTTPETTPEPEPVTAVAEPEPTPEPEPVAAVAGPTVKDAVKVAMEMVASGRASEVKQIIAGLSAEKVSALEGDEIQQFLDAAAAVNDL